MTTAIYEPILAKLQRLPEPLLQEIDAFIDFLQTRLENQEGHSADLTFPKPEDGMNPYLRDLESYEEMLAAGTVKW